MTAWESPLVVAVINDTRAHGEPGTALRSVYLDEPADTSAGAR